MDDVLKFLAASLAICFFLTVVVFVIRACVVDARRRGKAPVLVALLVCTSFPLGLLLWLLFRPEPIDSQRRQVDLKHYRAQ